MVELELGKSHGPCSSLLLPACRRYFCPVCHQIYTPSLLGLLPLPCPPIHLKLRPSEKRKSEKE